MKSESKKDTTCYMTAGVKCKLLRYSQDIRNALGRFQNHDFGTCSGRPDNNMIVDFGSYDLTFGTLWIISYDFFTDRNFVTVLLPDEFEGKNYKTLNSIEKGLRF